jgi:hypothetical protein
LYDLPLPGNVISLFVGCSGENWQPNMILDDGGDATHIMVKKYPAVFKLLKVGPTTAKHFLLFAHKSEK